MIVIDASAVVAGLQARGPAREVMSTEDLGAPHLIDLELAQVFRRHVRAGTITAHDGWQALDRWRHLQVTRYPVFAVLDRIWELRHNLSAYDASYVSVAETLDCTLVTADGRLARASGIRCPVTLVPA